jgi:uncharacterized membrane protein
MTKGRLEAFSDGVIAILITIMVLELKVPHGEGFAALRPMIPAFLAYLLSFVFLGLYWNNHHHLLHAAGRIDGKVLWANLHLLFWLSLVPVTTGWLGDHSRASLPAAVYGVVLLLAGAAYFILEKTLIAAQGPDSKLAKAVGRRGKEVASVACYALAIPLAFVHPWISIALYVLVAVTWLVPDRRIEKLYAS